MTDYTLYKFEAHPGLPPEREPGPFFGFNAAGESFILRWHPKLGYWVAAGFQDYAFGFQPLVVECTRTHADFIKSWSRAPAPWPKETKNDAP